MTLTANERVQQAVAGLQQRDNMDASAAKLGQRLHELAEQAVSDKSTMIAAMASGVYEQADIDATNAVLSARKAQIESVVAKIQEAIDVV